MRRIIDANVVAALVLPLPYSDRAAAQIVTWKRDGAELLAPMLLEYELTAVLRKAAAAGWLATELAIEAFEAVMALSIVPVAPTQALHERALRWAERLGQSRAYDAQYLAVAEQEGLELWTADRRLVRNAEQAGVRWVRWIGEVGEGL